MNDIQFLTQIIPKDTEDRLITALNCVFTDLYNLHKQFTPVQGKMFNYDTNIKNGEPFSEDYNVHYDDKSDEYDYTIGHIVLTIDIINQKYCIEGYSEKAVSYMVSPGDWNNPPEYDGDFYTEADFDIICNDFRDFLNKLSHEVINEFFETETIDALINIEKELTSLYIEYEFRE